MRRSINNRRSRKKLKGMMELQLTSMMDIMTIILVFLLKSHSASTNNFASVNGIEIPFSQSQEVPPDSLQVIVTPEGLTFENSRIVEFTQNDVTSSEPEYAFKSSDLDEGGRRILPLYDALTKAREQAEILRSKSTARDENGNPLPFDGILAIQADKRVRYETIRKIMYSAAAAGYKTFRFLAQSRQG